MKVDNFSLTIHQACPAKYLLRIKENWQARFRGGALNFGAAFHAGLDAWYKHMHLSKQERLQLALAAIQQMWGDDVPPDDHRTLQLCVNTFIAYVKQYPSESFSVIGAPDSPMAEVSFTLPLVDPKDPDKQLTTYDGEPIEYGGIFDTLVEFGPMVYILEHKTTSQLGPYYFNQFKPNNQVTGYVWAASLLSGKRVGGAIINAICVTRTGKMSFARQVTTRSEEEVSRWTRDVQATCNEIKRHEAAGHWPYRTTSCTQYGLCEFHSVHVIADEETQQKKLEQDYVKRPWNHETRDEPATPKEE